jgi:GNAT superfamily N-acetyltransferase
MAPSGIAVQIVNRSYSDRAVRFLSEWLCDGEADARTYLAEHAEPNGISMLATSGLDPVGYAAIVWESNYEGFRSRGTPLLHQIVVGERWRRRGIATLLMDAAEGLLVARGISELGVTVGLFDEYGPAQRMYAKRGYVPDGRGVCKDQRPLSEGEQISLDHAVMLWLTKDLAN